MRVFRSFEYRDQFEECPSASDVMCINYYGLFYIASLPHLLLISRPLFVNVIGYLNWQAFYQFVCLCCIDLCVCCLAYFSVSMPVSLPVYLPACLSVCLSVCLSLCLCLLACLLVYVLLCLRLRSVSIMGKLQSFGDLKTKLYIHRQVFTPCEFPRQEGCQCDCTQPRQSQVHQGLHQRRQSLQLRHWGIHCARQWHLLLRLHRHPLQN